MNNEQLVKNERNVGADIIRCLAFFLVVSVHFFLNSGYYYVAVEGPRMFVMTFMRNFSIICVPLFMTLSGYLMRKKELSVKYYKKLGKTYLTYVLASVFCISFSVIFLKEAFSIKKLLFSVLEFSGAPYSWYVEMYISFFLLVPFLNLIYNNIPSKRWKQFLVLVFIIITALPSVVNAYNFSFTGGEWWHQPSLSNAYQKIIPQWWTGIYPVTYYFIGSYLSEFKPKIKPFLNVLLIFVTTLISAAYSFWRSYKINFVWGDWCAYQSLFSVIITTLVFILFINISYTSFPKVITVLLKKMSSLCFGAYLLSWIFDSIFYPILTERFPKATDCLFYYFLIVPAVFVCSLLLSYVLSKLQFLLEFACSFAAKKLTVKSKK